MNIAYVVVKHIAQGGGIEKYTEEIGARLVERGHQVRVYAMPHYGDVSSPYRGMEIMTTPCFRMPQLEKVSASLYSTMHASVNSWADLVHLQHVVPGALAWLVRFCGKPSVIQYHGLEWKRSRWGWMGQVVLKALEQWSVCVNHHFTAVSKEQCHYFHRTYGIDIRYIPTGAEIPEPTSPQEILALGLMPKRYILFASRLVQEKGAHYLIPAFRRLDTDCKLVIAGDIPGGGAYKQHLLQLAGDDARIIFPGFVTGRLRDELFSHALVYVQPSDIEGLSIALLEAMSYGLCCLVSDIPANKEAVGEQAISFQCSDIDDLSVKLRMVLAKKTMADVMATGAVERVRAHFCWDRITDQFEEYYQEIIACHQQTALPKAQRRHAEKALSRTR
ncbi:MAG: glycosyltransferase family 4 protein [Armatimonadota bacterium]